jgi:hypothetical protein
MSIPLWDSQAVKENMRATAAREAKRVFMGVLRKRGKETERVRGFIVSPPSPATKCFSNPKQGCGMNAPSADE